MNKKIYLKPYCAIVPIRVQAPLCESLRIDGTETTSTQLSRETEYNDYPQSRSVWDD